MGSAHATCEDLPYDIGLVEVRAALARVGVKDREPLIVVQLPDGMKPFASSIAKCIEEATGARVVIHGDSVFGACDIAWDTLSRLNPDLVIHYGHTPYPPWLADGSRPPERYVFIEARSKLPLPKGAVADAARMLSEYGVSRVGVTASVQHVHLVRKAAALLAEHGLEPVIPRGKPPYFHDGQVIGCEYSVALSSGADAFLFIGGGVFHPLGLYLASKRPVVKVDPYRGMAEDVTGRGERVLRARLFKVAQAFDASRWGLIAGLRSGQYRPWLLRRLERELTRRGREYIVIATATTNEYTLRSVDNDWFQAFVVTSCPRIPIDDLAHYEKPVLTPGEAFMALAGRLEPYRFPW